MLEVRAMHRDIKHENILVSRSGHLVLSDFGGSHVLEDSARRIENVRMSDYVGTPGYMAPELWLNRDKPPSYFFSADIWSMGVVFLELLTGKRCFEGFTEERIHRVINCYPIPCGTVADPVARDLVRRVWRIFSYAHQCVNG